MEEDKYTIKAVMRCFQILDLAIAKSRPISITDVSEALKVNPNMAFRMLSSLAASGFMAKDKTSGQFSISLKVLQLSRTALVSLEIRKTTVPYLELLWNHYQKANVNMAVFHNGDILVIDRIDSLSLPRTYFTPGKIVPFHCSATGKVLISEFPEKEIDSLIEQKGLKSFTENTITDPQRLKDELAFVRANNYAYDHEEYILKDNCIAAPIRDRTGKIVAAISLSAFENYMTVSELEGALPALHDTVRKISNMLGHNDGML
jgi:DNA-binding IclR family transcriptional regulator